jgi:hypothetical protein
MRVKLWKSGGKVVKMCEIVGQCGEMVVNCGKSRRLGRLGRLKPVVDYTLSSWSCASMAPTRRRLSTASSR